MIQRLLLLSLIFFAFSTIVPGEYYSIAEENQKQLSGNTESFDQRHTVYGTLLDKYVRDGKVNYRGFISSADKFGRYLDQLASVSEEDFTGWPREERLAFWINAYNAFTIKAIIDNYPIERKFSLSALIYPKNSIRQIDGVWDELEFRAAGRTVTLNQIEHEILRKEFNEPRIHSAIVCASIGCPDLLDEPYVAGKIDQQLHKATVNFVNNPDKGVRISRSEGEVSLSKIFNWFGGDFVPDYNTSEFFKDKSEKERAVLNFVRKHLRSDDDTEFLINNDLRISYMDYDWSLNEYKSKN